MTTQTPKTEIAVAIVYTPLAGCTLKAVRLAREIEYGFGLTVSVQEGTDGSFKVTVNGVSVYKSQGPCAPGESLVPILNALKRYREPIREMAATLPNTEQENDPEYRAWLRSVCSGE